MDNSLMRRSASMPTMPASATGRVPEASPERATQPSIGRTNSVGRARPWSSSTAELSLPPASGAVSSSSCVPGCGYACDRGRRATNEDAVVARPCLFTSKQSQPASTITTTACDTEAAPAELAPDALSPSEPGRSRSPEALLERRASVQSSEGSNEPMEMDEYAAADSEGLITPVASPSGYGDGKLNDSSNSLDFTESDGLSTSSFHFFGVYDGHGSAAISGHCAGTMHERVREAAAEDDLVAGLLAQPSDEAATPPERLARRHKRFESVFSKAFRRCDASAPGCVGARVAEGSGSTALAALVGDGHVSIANCGDSRAVLCRAGEAVPLSVDHKPDRHDEQQRVEALGGQVVYWHGFRVQGILAMSRAIGDHCLRPYIIPDPEVNTVELVAEDEFVILATDGLWDALSNEDACNAAARALARWRADDRHGNSNTKVRFANRRSGEQLAAEVLVRLALAKGSADNVSAVVIDLSAHRPGGARMDSAMDSDDEDSPVTVGARCRGEAEGGGNKRSRLQLSETQRAAAACQSGIKAAA